MAQKFVAVSFTFALPGYWLVKPDGENVYSYRGEELTEAGRALAHQFPCNCDKPLLPHHLVGVAS
jgi:hypothetical protein